MADAMQNPRIFSCVLKQARGGVSNGKFWNFFTLLNEHCLNQDVFMFLKIPNNLRKYAAKYLGTNYNSPTHYLCATATHVIIGAVNINRTLL